MKPHICSRKVFFYYNSMAIKVFPWWTWPQGRRRSGVSAGGRPVDNMHVAFTVTTPTVHRRTADRHLTAVCQHHIRVVAEKPLKVFCEIS